MSAPAAAIVGAGPRGLFALERLLAHLAARPGRPGRPVEVHVFDPGPFPGAGPNYRHDQPEWLLLNFPVSHVDAWTEEDPRAPAASTPSLLRWLREREGDGWDDASLASRALVGRYLSAQLESVVRSAPDDVTIVIHRAEVVDVEREGPRFRLRAVGRGGGEEGGAGGGEGGEWPELPPFLDVAFCLGHTPHEDDDERRRDRAFADASPGAVFVPRPFPVDALDAVPPGAAVGVRGMGLSFIDVAVALTEGRGGRFEAEPGSDVPVYVPSGREPAVLVPFSPSGLLPSPKPDGPWPARRAFVPTYFTGDAVRSARDRAGGGPLDWEEDVWPLLRAEMELAWYRVAAGAEPGREIRGVAGHPDRCEAFLREARLDPNLPRFDPGSLTDPRTPADFESGPAHHRFTVERLAHGIRIAGEGPGRSPEEAAAEVWNKLFPLVWRTVRFHGLTPAGRRRFHDAYQRPFARRTFGPPLANALKVLALARAGLLDFAVAAGGSAEPGAGSGAGWTVRSERIAGEGRPVDHLVDARLPGPAIEEDATPLVRNLLRRGLTRPHRVGDDERTGGPDIVPGTATLVDAEGRAVDGLTAMGWLIEGPTVGNDALFREVNDYSGVWAARAAERLRGALHLGGGPA